jgi:hypothetical protein
MGHSHECVGPSFGLQWYLHNSCKCVKSFLKCYHWHDFEHYTKQIGQIYKEKFEITNIMRKTSDKEKIFEALRKRIADPMCSHTKKADLTLKLKNLS